MIQTLRKKVPPPSRLNAPCPPSRSRSARPLLRSHPEPKNHPKLSSIHSRGPIREPHSAAASDRTRQNSEQCQSHTRQAHTAPAAHAICAAKK